MDNITTNKDGLKIEKVEKKKNAILSFVGRIGSVIFSIFTYGIIAIVLALMLSYFTGGGDSVRVLGYSSFFIETDSMEMVMPAGTLVFTKENPLADYKIGDDISFFGSSVNGKVVTHRIVEISEDDDGDKYYVTKGTNNPEKDKDPVYPQNIIGKVILTVPEVGIYVDYIRENIIISIVFLLSFIFIVSYLYKEVTKAYRSRKLGGLDNKGLEPVNVDKEIIKERNNHEPNVSSEKPDKLVAVTKRDEQSKKYFLKSKKKNMRKSKPEVKEAQDDEFEICMLNIFMESTVAIDENNRSMFEFIIATSSETRRFVLEDKRKISINLGQDESYTIMFKNNLESFGYDVDISNDHGVSVAGNTINVIIRVRENINNKKINETKQALKTLDEDILEESDCSVCHDFAVSKQNVVIDIDSSFNKSLLWGKELNQTFENNLKNDKLVNENEIFANLTSQYNDSNSKVNCENLTPNSFNTLEDSDLNYPKHALNYVSFNLKIKHYFNLNDNKNAKVLTSFKIYDSHDLTQSFTLSMKGEGILESEHIRFYQKGIYHFYIACIENDLIKFSCDQSLYKLTVEVVEEESGLRVKEYNYISSNKKGYQESPMFVTNVL